MNDDTPYNEFDEFDDFEPEDRELHDEYGDFRQSAYDRWRPAIAAFAVLLTVVAIAVVGNGDNGSNSESSNPDVVVESTNVPLVTVPLTRTLKTGMKGDDVLRVQQRLPHCGSIRARKTECLGRTPCRQCGRLRSW